MHFRTHSRPLFSVSLRESPLCSFEVGAAHWALNSHTQLDFSAFTQSGKNPLLLKTDIQEFPSHYPPSGRSPFLSVPTLRLQPYFMSVKCATCRLAPLLRAALWQAARWHDAATMKYDYCINSLREDSGV